MSVQNAFLDAAKRDLAMVMSLFVAVVILVAGVSYAAGYQSAKGEVRSSYCHVFGKDPRCGKGDK